MAWISELNEKGVKNVILTKGEKGIVFSSKNQKIELPALTADIVNVCSLTPSPFTLFIPFPLQPSLFCFTPPSSPLHPFTLTDLLSGHWRRWLSCLWNHTQIIHSSEKREERNIDWKKRFSFWTSVCEGSIRMWIGSKPKFSLFIVKISPKRVRKSVNSIF